MPLLAPSPYRLAADRIESLPADLGRARAEHGITAKAQAEAIGIGTDTLARVEAGANVTKTTIVACLRWLA